jgi:hypothetical protein
MRFDKMTLAFIGLYTLCAATIIWVSASTAHREPSVGPVSYIRSHVSFNARFGNWVVTSCKYGDIEVQCTIPASTKEAEK